MVNSKCIVLCSCYLWGGTLYGRYTNGISLGDLNPTSDTDLKLPGEKTYVKVTEDELKGELLEIGELSAYSYQYHGTQEREYTQSFLDNIPVIGTKATVKVDADGIVKAGYNLDDVVINVEGNKIFVSLPEAKINDNYIIWDTIECKEGNNILNPIKFEMIDEVISDIEKQGLDKANEENVCGLAEKHLKDIIVNQFSKFDGYEVVFM